MKVVQIGFNKCGTTSIDYFLKKCGYKTLHWDHGKLAPRIKNNIDNKEAPFLGYEEYQCFSDMEYVTNKEFLYAFIDYYKDIDRYYDDVYFILNVRPLEKWLKSRINHNNRTYLSRFVSIRESNEEEVIEYWRKLWVDHINDVKNYFQNKSNCLVFDIEKDSGDQLCKFLGVDVTLAKHYGHYHQTAITK